MLQPVDLLADVEEGGVVGFQVAFFTRDDEAALSRLGVGDGRLNPLHFGQNLVGMGHPAVVVVELRCVSVNDDGAAHENGGQQEKADGHIVQSALHGIIRHDLSVASSNGGCESSRSFLPYQMRVE